MDLIDTSRYPIDRLGSDEGQAFVTESAAVFATNGVVVLPGFLTPAAVQAMAAEATAKIGRAFHTTSRHTVFLDAADEADEADGFGETRVASIANDHLDPSGTLQRLYDTPELTRFIATVLRYDNFHCGADPLGALSINVYSDGDRHDWHFDESHFSVTLMVQEAERGGHFEYVTGLRTDNETDHDAIAAVLGGDTSRVERLPFATGALSIFGGRNTLHRVTTVEGDQPRFVPVLTYDTVPGSVNSDQVRMMFWGRTG